MGRVELYNVIFEDTENLDVPPIKTERTFKNEEALKEEWAENSGRFRLLGYDRVLKASDSVFIHVGIYREEDVIWPEE